MLRVKLFPTLAKRARSGALEMEMPWEPGMRVIDVITREGFSDEEAEVIAAVINGEMAISNEAVLEDGDEVELRVAIAGG